MGEVFKGLVAGGWNLLAGWIFPTFIAVSLFAFLVGPALEEQPVWRELVQLDGGDQALVAVGASTALALLLNSVQTPLYRMLEGYLWPERLQVRRIEAQRTAKADAARRADQSDGLLRLVLLETGYERFPVADDQIAPTRLGNAIRRLEEYGFDRFRLDSQLLWEELVAVAPESVVAAVDRARAKVDFFVCLTYVTVLFVVATVVVAAATGWGWPGLWITALAAALTWWPWYRLAIATTDDWAYHVKALVNVGRFPLAAALGLRVPVEVAEERKMWTLVGSLVETPYAEQPEHRLRALEQYRTNPPAAD